MRRYALAFVAGIAAPASAQQTTTYTYDALGRLVGSVVESNATVQTNTAITYDPAANRKTVKVATSASGGGPGGGGTPGGGGPGGGTPTPPTFVVVPLNGFTVIPISTS